MSLRPSLSSFKLKTLTGLFGCGDADVENAVLRRIRKDYASNMPLRVRASELVRTIIQRGRDAPYPHDEDESVQIVVNALARHGQDHIASTSIFWEQFFAESETTSANASDPHVRGIITYLTTGRPLLGSRMASSWAFYAYLLDGQVVRLRDFIRADARLSSMFGADDALAWLDATCDAGRDIWCWVS